MQCKLGDLCPSRSAVRRKEAVQAVCAKLAELISRDSALVSEVFGRTRELNSGGDEDRQNEIAAAQKTVTRLSRQIGDLRDLAGQGSEDDRHETTSRIRSAQAQRSAEQLTLSQLQSAEADATKELTPDRVNEILADMSTLLRDAAAGQLGADAVYKALAIFRQLTGGSIAVQVEQRIGRKRKNVRGSFTFNLPGVVADAESVSASHLPEGQKITLWLREPPQLDLLAEHVHRLLTDEHMTYEEAAVALNAEGHDVKLNNMWVYSRRWYQMNGLPVPKRIYNNGQPRRSR